MVGKIITGVVTTLITTIVVAQIRQQRQKQVSVVNEVLRGQDLIVTLSDGTVIRIDTEAQTVKDIKNA